MNSIWRQFIVFPTLTLLSLSFNLWNKKKKSYKPYNFICFHFDDLILEASMVFVVENKPSFMDVI